MTLIDAGTPLPRQRRKINPWLGAVLVLLAGPVAGQGQVTPPGAAGAPPPKGASAQAPLRRSLDSLGRRRNWSLHFQQTVIDQWHNDLATPYTGSYSLQDREKAKLSLTTTLFIARRLWRGGTLVFNPEVAGGSGLSSARGVAGFPNGETFRIGDPSPNLYLARLFWRQVLALGTATEAVEDDLNQLPDDQPTHYLALNVGKFSIADYFDQNNYSHDPRTQFFNWSLMSAGAWDYPANTRGYTVGAVLEYVTPTWALRAATTAVPTTANGPVLDSHYGTAHAETVELTRALRLGGHPGQIRLLGFRNVAAMGDYRAAVASGTLHPHDSTDLSAVSLFRTAGHQKIGLALNLEQEITTDLGLFARISYNDGKYETWAFTEIDRSASLGAVLTGQRWHRPNDRFGAAVVANGLSDPHRDYLAAGGYGFIIGDGALNYAPEYIGEVYYSFDLLRQHASISPDFQLIINPAYNRDRSGPVSVAGLRLHVEF